MSLKILVYQKIIEKECISKKFCVKVVSGHHSLCLDFDSIPLGIIPGERLIITS